MAEAIAAPDFAFGDSSILGEIIDFTAPDNALELGPFAGVSIFDGALAFLCIQCTIDQQLAAHLLILLASASHLSHSLVLYAACQLSIFFVDGKVSATTTETLFPW